MADENETYTPEEEDLVDRELGIAESLTQHDELVNAVQSGLQKTWSFETLAIQAELEKQSELDPDRKWLEGTLKTSYYDVQQEPEEILAEINFSSEGFQERATSLLESVLKFLARMLSNAVGIIKQCSDFLIGIESRAKRIRYWAENSKYKHVNPGAQLELGRSVTKLMVGKAPVKNVNELTAQLAVHAQVLNDIKQFLVVAMRVGNDLAAAVNKFDFKNPDASLESIRTAYKGLLATDLYRLCKQGVGDTRFFVNKGGEIRTSAALMGAKQFYLTAYAEDATNAVTQLRTTIRSQLSYQYSNQAQSVPTGAKFQPMSADEIIGVMNQVLALSATARELSEREIEDSISKLNARLSEASKRFLRYFDQTDRQVSKAAVEIAVDAVKAFSVQTTSPMLNYLSTLNSSLRVVVTLGKGSLAALR